MIDTAPILNDLTERFLKTQSPVPVNFRALVPSIPYNSIRYTHALHSYPAKIIPQIPHFFLNCSELCDRNSVVLDPFCGSGTVILEACLSGKNALASDSNPLARLITQTKVTPISPSHLRKRIELLRNVVTSTKKGRCPDVVNINYWYHKTVISDLARLCSAISSLRNSPFTNLCKLALSTTARKLSFADPRVAVPVKLKPERYDQSHPLRAKALNHLKLAKDSNAIEVFFQTLFTYGRYVESLWNVRSSLGHLDEVYSNSINDDQNGLSSHKPGSVDIVITSPPYLGAQKYIRSSSLSLGWLELTAPSELRRMESLSIGREHFSKDNYSQVRMVGIDQADRLINAVFQKDPLRACIASTYLIEMQKALFNCHRALRKGGKMVLVSGCNMLCGKPFDTTHFLQTLATNLGFITKLEVTDIIKSRGLMTRRNHTAAVIPLESVTVFEKQ